MKKLKGSKEFRGAKSDNELSVVLFMKEEGCPCNKQRVQLESAERYFTNAEFNVKFYSVNVEEVDNFDIMEDYGAFEFPVTTFIFGSDVWNELQGVHNVTEIVDTVFDIATQIEKECEVML